MKLKNRLLLSNNIIFASILIIIFSFLFFRVRIIIREGINSELANVSEQSKNMIESYVDASIKNHLTAIAQQTEKMVEIVYSDYKSGKINYNEMWNEVRKIILDPVYGKIGDTGYMAGVDGTGKLVIHPKSEGVVVKDDFMQQAVSMKNGFIEYDWKNKGEESYRKKVGGLSYFEPLDLIIWASSYKSEFSSLVNISDLDSKLKSITFGKTGYIYILDKNGKIVTHPSITPGTSMINEKDVKGFYFVKEMVNNSLKMQNQQKTKK